MTFRQRICGAIGHQSDISEGRHKDGSIYSVRLVCKKCGFRTRWFPVETYRDTEKDEAAWRYVANELKDLSKIICV